MQTRVEICAVNIESAIAAQTAGAHRVELCDNILEGGTTASAASIKLAKQLLIIPVNVLIRPRGGDFIYSDLEFQCIKEDILFCKEVGVNGIVIGLLKSDGTVDIVRTKKLIELAWPMEVTFSRAFDLTPDPIKALEDIITAGVDRVLTSGQHTSAYDGKELISKLVKLADARISIMAGGGINEDNVQEIVKNTMVEEGHLTAKEKVSSLMEYVSPFVSMSSCDLLDGDSYFSSNPDKIKSIIKKLSLL